MMESRAKTRGIKEKGVRPCVRKRRIEAGRSVDGNITLLVLLRSPVIIQDPNCDSYNRLHLYVCVCVKIN